MATATAPARDRHVPRPKLRVDQLPAERTGRQTRPQAKNRPKKDEGHLFSVFIILVIGIAAIGFVVLAQRNAIIKYSLEAEALKDRIAESEVAQSNLQSQLGIMAASPQLQRTAVEDLKMASAENVSFIQSDKLVTPEELESALAFLDSKKAEILAYRDSMAAGQADSLELLASTGIGAEETPVAEGEEPTADEAPIELESPAPHLLPVVEAAPASSSAASHVKVTSGE